jgi:hypothetical protein
MFTCMVIFIYEVCNQMNMCVTEFCIMSCLWVFDMFYIQFHCLDKGIYGINKLWLWLEVSVGHMVIFFVGVIIFSFDQSLDSSLTTRPQRQSTFFYVTYINSVRTSQETQYISVV